MVDNEHIIPSVSEIVAAQRLWRESMERVRSPALSRKDLPVCFAITDHLGRKFNFSVQNKQTPCGAVTSRVSPACRPVTSQTSHTAALEMPPGRGSSGPPMTTWKPHGSRLRNSLSRAVCHVKPWLVLIHLALTGWTEPRHAVVPILSI